MIREVRDAFRAAGKVAFDCWSYLESQKAEEKGVTDPIETFHLFMIDSDDPEIKKGGSSMLNQWERTKKDLPKKINAGYLKFISFVKDNGGDRGIDAFFEKVFELMESDLAQLTRQDKLLYAIGLVEPIRELAERKYEPYKIDRCYMKVFGTKEGGEGDYLSFLCYMGKQYINALDAALLKAGMDIFEVQNRCGVRLLQVRDIISLSSILGGYSIALAYINALRPQVTEREREYFARAIGANLIRETEEGYEWLREGRGSKAQLAYFISKMYHVGQQIPYKRLESLFGVSRLDSAVSQLMCAKNPPKWVEEIDKIFTDENST